MRKCVGERRRVDQAGLISLEPSDTLQRGRGRTPADESLFGHLNLNTGRPSKANTERTGDEPERGAAKPRGFESLTLVSEGLSLNDGSGELIVESGDADVDTLLTPHREFHLWRLRLSLRHMDAVETSGRADDERRAGATLSPIERRVFVGTLRYVVDQASRPGTATARAVLRSGLVATVQDNVGRQVIGLSAAIGFGGIVAELAFTVGHRSGPLEAAVLALLFSSAVLLGIGGLVRMRSTARWAADFKREGRVVPSLGQPAPTPVRLPKLAVWPVIAVAIEYITIGLLFLTASATAPRITGVAVTLTGLLFLGVVAWAIRTATRR